MDERKARIATLPRHQKQGFIDDYYPHMWKDPNAARQFLKTWGNKTGVGGALKKRSIPHDRGRDRGRARALAPQRGPARAPRILPSYPFIRRIRSTTISGFSIIRKCPPSGTYSIV